MLWNGMLMRRIFAAVNFGLGLVAIFIYVASFSSTDASGILFWIFGF
jgi:hypothetical protein